MAEKSFLARIFGRRISEENEIIQQEITEENDETTLQDVINFVTELQSYYYNDVCKMQTDLLVQTSLPQNKVSFLNKKIKQDQIALLQIDNILKLVKQNEREYQSILRKSIYSFYDEIEKAKLVFVQKKIFDIILKLYVINTKKELESVIINRIEKYRASWNISQKIPIPTDYKVILVNENDGIEQYYFGKFQKEVYATDGVLISKQLDRIRQLEFKFKNEISTENVWIYVSSVTRIQLNFTRRTCIINNDWEYAPQTCDGLFFDIVEIKDLEQYIKGLLQIVFTKRRYSVISIIIPTKEMLSVIGKIQIVGKRVKICEDLKFYIKQRSGIYKENLLTTRIDRRNIPDELYFIPYTEFRKLYF